MHWLHIRGLAASDAVWLRADEMEMTAIVSHEDREGLLFY